MNSTDSFTPWLAPLGWLALETSLVVLAALALQPLLRTAAARRSLWRAALVALLVVLAAELSGTGSQLPAQLRLAWTNAFPPASPAPELPFAPPPVFPLAPIGGEGRGEGAAPIEITLPEPTSALLLPPAHSPTFSPAPVPVWPALLWLTGLAALLARSAWTHAGFAWLRLRHFIPAAEALRERVQALAARLGLRRRVRVLASERLRAPAAFGWVRPGVAVPGDFTARFAPAQQDVMLAHELAHLAARDPLWQLLADLVTAALWWHPLAWVARRQHRLAGELAADDASLALPDGPVVLAECLITLGHEAADCPRAALGMAGFRSQLGRRVERLLALPGRDWQAPSRARLALQTAVTLLALTALALLPGCAANRTASEAPSHIVAQWWQAKKAPTPVAADVRSLQSNAERGTRNAESSQRLVTSSPANALDISVGRQLFVDDFLISSNSLKRTWHQPVLFSAAPLLARHDQIPPRHPFFESAWYEPTNQLFMLGLVNGTRFFTDYHSPSGTNWVPMHAQSHQGPLIEQPHRRVTTDYESLRVSLSREAAGTNGIQFSFARGAAEPVPQAGRPVIPPPVPTDGSRWTDMHPLRNGFLVVGRNLYCYFGGKVTNYGPRITVPGFHQEQAAIGLATLRRDGFASLDAGPEGGVLTTKPVTFTGKFMFVNMKTNAPEGELRIEILHPDGRPIVLTKNDTRAQFQPFSRENCIRLAADQTLMGVNWLNWTNGLASLTGRPVLIRFHLKNASLYSFWVGPGQLGRSMGRVAGGGPHFTNDVDTIGNRSYQPFPRTTNAAPALTPKPGALAVGDYLRTEVTFVQGTSNLTLRFAGKVAPAGYIPLPRVTRAVVVAGKTIEEARESIRQGYLAAGLENPVVKLTKTDPPPAAPTPAPSTNAPTAIKHHQPTVEKLARIRLPEVTYDGLPLTQVLKFLESDTRKNDLAKQGVSFGMRNTNTAAELASYYPPPRYSATNQPVYIGTGTVSLSFTENVPLPRTRVRQQALDHMETTAIKVTSVLRDVSVLDALDAIVKHAEAPIDFTIETNRVVFHPGKFTEPGKPFARLQLAQAAAQPTAGKWTPAQRAILQRLDTVMFPEVTYDGLPLPQVVKFLQQDGRKYDPEKQGFNFLLKTAAQPLEAPARIDLNNVLINVTSVFRGLTLAQVLDLVCKTASEPIQFVVEDYGIVFTPRDRGQPFVAPRLVERPAGVLTPAQRALLQRLDTVVFPAITYDGLPLPEVIKFLETDGRKHDPEKKGFNFLANSTSQPGDAATWVDLDVVLIHVTSVLKGLTLNQVLDVICKTADVRRPDGRNGGLQFIIEDYGIIFTPRDIAKPFVAPRLAEQPVGAAVRAKLDKIVIPQVAFDGLPLPEVLKLLAQDARKHDPDKQGVNLLATRHFPDPPPGWRGLPVGPDGKPLPRLLDAKGNPIPDPQPAFGELPDLDTVIINVAQVLNGLTLAQVLDVVCKTASRPITYRIEDYGVLITPKYSAPPVPKPGASLQPAPVAADVRRLTSPAAASQSLLTSAATVASGDSLKLTVAEDEAFSGIYIVKKDGNITLPRVGRVTVGGKRLDEARDAVKALLEATQVRTATVTLTFVGERASASGASGSTNDHRVIYLAGEFITPGPLTIPDGVQPTLITSIARSGGLTPNGDLSRVKLLRINNGQSAVEEVNVAAILSGTVPPADKPLNPGDIIMVPAYPPVVYVSGSVVKPGKQSFVKDEKLTAYTAILRAGGFAPGASLTNCHIVRDAGNGEKALLPFNVKDVQKDPAKDVVLQAGDIVVVPGSVPKEAPLLLPANPSPQPSPLAPQRAREPESAAPPTPVAADVRRLTSPQTPDAKPQTPTASQSLLTSAATNKVAAPDPLQAAEAKAARRQEQKLAMEKLLGEAGQFQKIKSWTNAVVRYEEAVGLAREISLAPGLSRVSGDREEEKPLKRLSPSAPADTGLKPGANEMTSTLRQLTNALAGLTHCRIQLAIALQEKHEFKAAAAEVDKVTHFYPGSPEAEQFKRFNRRVEAAHAAKLASASSPVSRGDSMAERANTLRLTRDGQLYYQMGDYQNAKERLEEAIKKDPLNEAAFYYLRLVMESEFDAENKKREKTYGDRVVEVSKKWNEKTRTDLPVPNLYYRTNSQVPFLTHSSKGAQLINRKLDEIVLPEVHFDGVTLAEVLKRLDADAKQFDPEKKGLNFLINDVVPPAPLLDANGNPVPVARPVALSEGLIRLNARLRNLTLRQVLDVICKTAELPTQFSVEEYAIAFIPRGPVAYYSRIFRVNPDTFIQGLQGVVGTPVLGVTAGSGNQPGAPGQNPPSTTSTTTGPVRATVPATVPATQTSPAAVNAIVRQFFQSAGVTSLGATNSSTQVIFNPENGLLLVRGTTNDLRIIEQAIQKVQPPSLTPTSTNAPARPASPAPSKPVVKIETLIFERSEPLRNQVGVSLANTLRLDTPGLFTNQVVRAADIRSLFWPPLTTNQLPADGRMECEFYEARTQLAVVMSGARREALLKSLVGSRQWSAPTVWIKDGQQGQGQSLDVSSVMVGTPRPANPGANAVNVTTGVTVDLWPKLSADSTSLQLGYVTDVREFLGYAPTSKNPPEAVPRFRVRQAIGTNTLAIGESLLLTVAATVPPPGKGSGPTPAGAERTLFVLLTATLDDSTGAAPERDRPGRNSPAGINAAPGVLPRPNPYYRTNSELPFLTHSSKGAQRINRKLDEIIVPEVHLDSVTLPEVVKWLDGESKKFDPEKKGLNFLINNVVSDYISLNPAAKSGKPAAPLLDPLGNPIASPAAKAPKPDLESALIKVTKPIKDLTLRQVLDVICMTATVKMPDGRTAGLKYSVEEYAIVFSPKLPEQAALFSRIFKVDAELFVKGLRSVVAIPSEAAKPSAVGAEKTRTSAPASTGQFNVAGVSVTNAVTGGRGGVVGTNLTAEVNNLVRDYFRAAGVTDLGVTNGPDATQVFFNDRNGLLLVRASLQDLDIIQMAIELLNVKPPHILIEAKFVEMNQNDGKALGFDWFVGTTVTKPVSKPATNRVVVIDREGNYQLDGKARSLEQVVAVLKEEFGANPNIVVRIRTPKDARLDAAMVLRERCLRVGIGNVSFTTDSVPEVEQVPARTPSAPNPTGVVPQPAQPSGAPSGKGSLPNNSVHPNFTGILTAPEFAVVLKSLMQHTNSTVITFPKVTTTSGKEAVGEFQADAKDKSGLAQGLKLEVVPTVAADGYTLNLTVIMSRDGKATLMSQCVVWDGQTVMLGYPVVSEGTTSRLPVLGDLPLVGRLFRPSTTTNAPGRFLLFLTPTLVDPAGNRIHRTDEELPFAPAAPAKK